ncbi:MAG TPA: N-acetylmuramoyl-L-alanine amidase [Candidatus Deferrimicrobium sp.]|nr:N-acetylmuramoyl-L-alanine amidase [Candidatus Deferrimicrobium sp.]
MNVIQQLVSPSKYPIKCPYPMEAECIVVHNTANDSNAENEVSYMIRNNLTTSFHYAIDDKQIVQGIPENRNAWHAGDGRNGRGNRKGVSVEICYSKSGGVRFNNAEKLAAKFIASKLKEKRWDISKVTKHQDYSGKICPHRTIAFGWQRFVNLVKVELDILNGPPDYTVVAGDSLWSIAAKLLGNGSRHPEITEMNKLTTNVLSAGQILKIPPK